jgi:hypothetical protein
MGEYDVDRKDTHTMPEIVRDYINTIIKKMRYRKKVREDVHAELTAHFEDALQEYRTPEQRQAVSRELIKGFGDTKLLAVLIRRAKKRCRPLWVKVMIRFFQVAGLCVLYILLCISRLYIGSPTIKIDTVAWINDAVQQGRDASLNARSDINKAVSHLIPMPETLSRKQPPLRDMNEVERQCLDQFLADNQAAFDELHEAVKKPYYWQRFEPVPTDKEWTGTGKDIPPQLMKTTELSAHLVEQVMPDLPKYRKLAFALRYQIQWYCDQGHADLALADCVSLIRFGRLQSGTGLLIEQLVGIAITALGTKSLLEVLDQYDVNEPVLQDTYTALKDTLPLDYSWLDFTCEKALADDMIQRGFTDDGHGNGRALASGVFLQGDSLAGNLKNLLLFDFPDRKQVVEHINAFYADLDQMLSTSPWDQQYQDDTLTDTTISTLYEGLLKPALERLGVHNWRLKIYNQAVLTILAIKRYEARHGVLPDTLQDLVSDDLINELPRDFYADGPLVYRRDQEGFILYSWGDNLKDDGGTPSTNANGKPQLFRPNGDWIFWPIE